MISIARFLMPFFEKRFGKNFCNFGAIWDGFGKPKWKQKSIFETFFFDLFFERLGMDFGSGPSTNSWIGSMPRHPRVGVSTRGSVHASTRQFVDAPTRRVDTLIHWSKLQARD